MRKISILFFFLLLGLIIGSPAVVNAQTAPDEGTKLEIEYIPFADAPVPTRNVTLPAYVKYLYYFAIGVCGLIALLAIIIAGFRYTTSAGNPEKMRDSKSQIFAAVLGLTILFFSWIILRTINPQLVVLRLPEEIPPILPNIESGVYVCKERIDVEGFWTERMSIESETPEEQKRVIAETLNPTLKALEQHCYAVSTKGNIRETFNDEVRWVYLVPEFRKSQYGVILYEQTAFSGASKIFYGDTHGSANAPEYPTEWKIPEDFLASSAKPFSFNSPPAPSSYVALFQSIDYNRGYSESQIKCWAATGSVSGCEDMDLDKASGYLVPGMGPLGEVGSVKVEGSLIAIFIRSLGEDETWTLEQELDVYSKSDTNLNNNKMGNWREDCVETKQQDPAYRRPYPCADKLVIISASIY